jgi:hypothetical protein
MHNTLSAQYHLLVCQLMHNTLSAQYHLLLRELGQPAIPLELPHTQRPRPHLICTIQCTICFIPTCGKYNLIYNEQRE